MTRTTLEDAVGGAFDGPVRARTTVELVADAIRARILQGRFRPGTPLPETTLATALRVSRNTVREALRLLVAEHLLVLEPHRGATVRALSVADVDDIYRTRRLLELGAIDALAAGTPLPADAFRRSLLDADAAVAAGDWAAAGTASLHFHTELVGLHGSRRFDAFFTRVMAEMRLGFLALDDPRAFHEPYLHRNRALAERLRAGEHAAARADLAAYLDEAARQVREAVAARG